MNTKIFKIDRNNIDFDIITSAGDVIKRGDLVAFPTETVYGLGADGLNPQAVSKIYEAKGRPADNPLILHISSIDMLYNLVDEVNDDAKKLMGLCWPGPLTMIFKKSDIIPDIISAGLDTVAIRFPSDNIARALISAADTPIAAPSANISGRPSPTRADDVFYDMDGTIPMIIDGGSSNIGIESTVIDMSEVRPIILRPGYFTLEYIQTILPSAIHDEALISEDKIPKSPGQKYRHYSPRAKMQVYIGDRASETILKKAKDYKLQGLRVGVITFDDKLDDFRDFKSLSFGSRENLDNMAHNLFTYLRDMDKAKVDIILAEGVGDEDLGKSIMNRMKKSASGNVYYV